MAEHKDSYCYRVKGLFVPFLTPEFIERDINKYIDKIGRLTEDLETSFNDGVVTDFVDALEKIQELLQAICAKQCESYTISLLHAAKSRGIARCGKMMQQAIADFLLLSIELQKAQKVAAPPALKYENVEINEEAARSLSSIERLISAGDYSKAQSMAEELKDTDASFAKLSGMLASREYDRARELATTMEKEHIDLIRRTDTKTAKTVLAVDDMPEILSIVTTALRNHYKVLGAPDGKVAVDIMNQQNIDLFFVDIDMPVMNGFELAARIRSDPRYKKTPVLFLTGNASRKNIEKAINLGSDEFIVKPAYDVALLAKARKYLG